MHPIARDEVYRIGHEAILNACTHSVGKRLSIELVYNRQMLLRIRDDGKGIDAETLKSGKAGHFGLTGMRERAARISAEITISSSPKGTIVTLLVPGRIIYKLSRARGLLKHLRLADCDTVRSRTNSGSSRTRRSAG
jgi:signal transduction histidine kinase